MKDGTSRPWTDFLELQAFECHPDRQKCRTIVYIRRRLGWNVEAFGRRLVYIRRRLVCSLGFVAHGKKGGSRRSDFWSGNFGAKYAKSNKSSYEDTDGVNVREERAFREGGKRISFDHRGRSAPREGGKRLLRVMSYTTFRNYSRGQRVRGLALAAWELLTKSGGHRECNVLEYQPRASTRASVFRFASVITSRRVRFAFVLRVRASVFRFNCIPFRALFFNTN